MTIYQKLEKRLGRYAIPNLMQYICAMYVVGFIILLIQPAFYAYYLDLDPEAIVHGHIWRIITFLFYPPSMSPIWMIVAVFVYYSLGMTLERIWGTFRYNLFFFMGALMLVLGGILIYLFTGLSLTLYPTFMNFGIFLAYALTFPEATFLIYFILPVKAKYLAAFEVLLYLYYFFIGGLAEKVMIGLALLNVAVFFMLVNQKPRRKNVYHINDFR